MVIYPAIDLRGSKVVRLKYGDPNQQTIFDDDPIAVAQHWAEAGARWLHVVNLDGAFGDETGANRELLTSLASLGPQVQFGGGLRTLAEVERALSLGVARVVLGTLAIERPDVLRQAVERFGPERIAAGLDARSGQVKTRGWQTDSGLDLFEAGRRVRALGVEIAIHTDIARDGDLSGVNAEASAMLARATGLRVIASGGVSSLPDLRRLRGAAGIDGVIIGRALYTGAIDLKSALEELAHAG